MKLFLLFLLSVTLAGCGGGHGGSSATPLTPPPPPPVVPHRAYSGAVVAHTGLLAGEVATLVDYDPNTDTLAFSTVAFGDVTVDFTRRFYRGGKAYAVTFTSTQLIVVDVLTSNDGAAWVLTLIAANG